MSEMWNKSQSAKNNLQPIFIGGTGRSGTTVLSQFIGSNENAVRIPFESRFLLDKDGLLNLCDALTRNFSIYQGRVALRDFEKLMVKGYADPFSTPYLGFNRIQHINKETIITSTQELIKDCSFGTFSGIDLSTIDSWQGKKYFRRVFFPVDRVVGKLTSILLKRRRTFFGTSIRDLPKEKMYIPKYFNDEKVLFALVQKYLLRVFKDIFEKENNLHLWCEDTPSNILHIEFISKVFPNAKFIHIMRHPIGVAYSMKKMIWSPHNIEQVCDFLEGIYHKLIHIHQQYENSENYKFIKLEELVFDDKKEELNKFIGLDSEKYSGEISIDLNKMDYYKKKMPQDEIKYVSERLKKAIEFFQYS